MKQSSLHLRLSIAAAISIICALTVSGFFFMFLFERHVQRRVDQELSVYVKQLANTLEIETSGRAVLDTPLADPRFRRPFSGLYWQIEEDAKPLLRSRSLWDQALTIPETETKPGQPSRTEIPGPDGETLIARSRKIYLETNSGDRAFRLIAAINKTEIISARGAFSKDLTLALGLLSAALLIASLLQIYFGLRPLSQIRQRITNIRTGSSARLEGTFPSEVQLLVREVNALIKTNEQAVERARDSAADLAHGLKTPLAVLQAESHSLADRHQTDSAREIATQVEQMHDRVERHLALVRLRGPSAGAIPRTDADKALTKIIAAMSKMPRGENLHWQLDVPTDLNVAIDTHDFFEVFGNLLDNARKWASRKITIDATRSDQFTQIHIYDDGPGVPEQKISEVLQRGKRLDENKQGSGLGLTIAQNILDVYGAGLSVENIEIGGLKVTVTIPEPTIDD